jgi:hypothetical protein
MSDSGVKMQRKSRNTVQRLPRRPDDKRNIVLLLLFVCRAINLISNKYVIIVFQYLGYSLLENVPNPLNNYL